MGMGKGCQGPWRRPLSAHISGSKGDWSVEKNNSKNIVYSVEKAFRVLHAFTSEAPELLLSDVARRADVDNATAFRMLNTLVQLEYVERVPETKRSEEHTSELQSLMRISYAVFCWKKK